MNTSHTSQTFNDTKPTINIGNQIIELYDPSIAEEYLNTSNNNSNPISLQTSSCSSEDEDFEEGGGGVTPRPTEIKTDSINFASGGGGGSSSCYMSPLKRCNSLPSVPITHNSHDDIMPLRIRAPSDELLQEILMNNRSDQNGSQLKQAHQKALNEMSPSFVFPETLPLKGPHYPKIRKSLSWSYRDDMTDEVITQIKEFNKHSPVARV
jgi:hypothetical protein